MSEREKSNESSLDALVNAASAATRTANDTTSPRPARPASSATADLDALLSQFDVRAESDKSAKRTQRVPGQATAAAPVNSSSAQVPIDLMQLAANAAGNGTARATPKPKPAVKTVSPAISDAVDQVLTGGPGRGSASPALIAAESTPAQSQPPRPSSWAGMNISLRGVMIVVTGLAIVGASINYYRDRSVTTDPGPALIQEKPLFALTPKQTELMGYLREARAEVERYRKANGRLPAHIELKVSGVHFYLRPVYGNYMLIAVSGHENLVLMGDGRWHKARTP